MKWAWLIVPGGLLFLGAALVAGYRADRAAAEPFAADAYVARAFTAARALASDAELSTLQARLVDPDGRVQARLGGILAVYFRSASHANERAKPAVLGAPAPPGLDCPRIRVAAHMRAGFRARHFDFDSAWSEAPECAPSLPAPPKCAVTAVWRRAIADGAPHPAFADLHLITVNDARTWTFEITDRVSNTVVFRRRYADDCKE